MTDLGALARAIADELAERDLVRRGGTRAPAGTPDARESLGKGMGPPPTLQNTPAHADVRHHTIAGPTNSSPLGVRFVRDQARIADFIDHTALKAETTRGEIAKLCDEALEHRFAAVCVNPSWVGVCAERLAGSSVQLATVVGFPLGATTSAAKRAETEGAVTDGATEIDMVAAIGHIKSAEWHYVADDIASVVHGAAGRLVKVIIESATLTPVEIIKVCALAKESGAHYVKTSTGFHGAGGATAEAVALMRMVVGDALGVKASGGVRDCEAALRMIASGATRIGTSSGVSMAKCLGQGPLPVNDLLSLAAGHVGGGCITCSSNSRTAAGAY